MDYEEEMLKLYFNENNISNYKKYKLLNSNPFDLNYIIWEKQTINNNKTFAITLKKKNIIDVDTPIQEIAIHEQNSVGKFLYNNVSCTTCSINDDINKVRLQNRLVLMKGFYPNEKVFLKRLQDYKIPFVTGICNKQKSYYLYVLREYKKMLEELDNCELINFKHDEQYLLILKTK